MEAEIATPTPPPLRGPISGIGEFALIDAITSGRGQPPTTLLGPGDDAAIVAASDGQVVISIDMLVDGVHFRSDWASGDQIGRRAALAAAADIAAMGAFPTAFVVAVSAPPTAAAELLVGIAAGLHEVADRLGAGVVGGDLTKSDVLTIAVTVLGDLRGGRAVRRDGARPGDVLAVAGRLGWAAAGLAVLSRGFRSPAAVVGAYREPDPPLAAGPAASELGATSMIDVSDGLLADVGHIARASRVAIDVRTADLDVPARLSEVGSALGRNALSWMLTGGDDHALAATFPPGTTLPPPWVIVGRVSAGAGVTVDGAVSAEAPGWDHFT